MSFPRMVVNVSVHTGEIALELALNDIMKPIEIAISGRKIATTVDALLVGPGGGFTNKYNGLEDIPIQDWINNSIIPSWKHNPALVCDWLAFWGLGDCTCTGMREMRLKSMEYHLPDVKQQQLLSHLRQRCGRTPVLNSVCVCVCMPVWVCVSVLKLTACCLAAALEAVGEHWELSFHSFSPSNTLGGRACVSWEKWRCYGELKTSLLTGVFRVQDLDLSILGLQLKQAWGDLNNNPGGFIKEA